MDSFNKYAITRYVFPSMSTIPALNAFNQLPVNAVTMQCITNELIYVFIIN